MTTLNVDYLRKALYIVGLRNDWPHQSSIIGASDEIAEEYDRVAGAVTLDPRVEEFMRADAFTGTLNAASPVPPPEPFPVRTIPDERTGLIQGTDDVWTPFKEPRG